LTGEATFAADLFDRTTVERLVGHYVRLLERASTDPTTRLSELDLVAADERMRVLREWNATTAHIPADRCLHELIEEQARQSPDAVALRHGVRQVSYAELDRRANRFARHLIHSGMQTGDLVGVRAGR